MAASGQGRLESEIDLLLCQRVDFTQHKAARVKSDCLGRKGRQALRNQVGIDEMGTVGILWQKLPCECGFAGAVGSSDDVNVGAQSASRLSG